MPEKSYVFKETDEKYLSQVNSLPRVPLYLLFNDADDELPAECSVLFERRVEKYLDMECVAIIGVIFSDYLAQFAGKVS